MSIDIEERIRLVERTAAQADSIHRHHDEAIFGFRTALEHVNSKLEELSAAMAGIGANLDDLKARFNGGPGSFLACQEHRQELKEQNAKIAAISESVQKVTARMMWLAGGITFAGFVITLFKDQIAKAVFH